MFNCKNPAGPILRRFAAPLASIVALLAFLAGEGRAQARKPFASLEDVKEWATARARFVDRIGILYLSWSCTHEGVLRGNRMRLNFWQRAAEGEIKTTWGVTQKFFGLSGDQYPDRWDSRTLATLRERAKVLSKAPKRAFACYQYGRYANWSTDRNGRWTGELLRSGNAYTLRDHLHMAIGLSHYGEWIVPRGFLESETTIAEHGDVVHLRPSNRREIVEVQFDEARRVTEMRFFTDQLPGARTSSGGDRRLRRRLRLQEARSPFGPWMPSLVSVLPLAREHLPMYYLVVEVQHTEKLRSDMLDRPPVPDSEEFTIHTVVDRLRDAREGKGPPPDRVRREVEQANVKSGDRRRARFPLLVALVSLVGVSLLWRWRRREPVPVRGERLE